MSDVSCCRTAMKLCLSFYLQWLDGEMIHVGGLRLKYIQCWQENLLFQCFSFILKMEAELRETFL